MEYLSALLQKSLNVYLKASRGESIEDLSDVDKKIELFVKGFEDKTNVKAKNDDAIVLLVNNSFIPFFKLLDSKMEAFNPLFFNCERIFYLLKNGNHEHNKFKITNSNPLSIKFLLDQKNINFLFEGQRVLSKGIIGFKYDYKFNGFKSNSNNFEIESIVTVEFTPYKYVIKDQKDQTLISKYYNEQLSEPEMVELVKTCVDNVMNEIKEKAENS